MDHERLVAAHSCHDGKLIISNQSEKIKKHVENSFRSPSEVLWTRLSYVRRTWTPFKRIHIYQMQVNYSLEFDKIYLSIHSVLSCFFLFLLFIHLRMPSRASVQLTHVSNITNNKTKWFMLSTLSSNTRTRGEWHRCFHFFIFSLPFYVLKAMKFDFLFLLRQTNDIISSSSHIIWEMKF